MTQPVRILALIGSGETSPSMARVQRDLIGRLGRRPVPAALLDTPYGFQENAGELSTRLTSFFADRVGNPVAVASFAGSGDETADHQVAMARLRDASFVFSGPGSPTYALRHWADSEVPALLADKLATGGLIVMASAAALTLGRLTAPIYEIYKVGVEPHWLPGLDLLSAVGLPVAVIPHYDNAEGGTHDTRFCFMGARRFEVLEAQMPDDTFILGIDENTALILDLASGRAKVLGKGAVTVRRRGRDTVFGTGADLAIAEIRTAAFEGERSKRRAPRPAVHQPTTARRSAAAAAGWSVAESERSFSAAIGRGDLPAATQAILSVADLLSGLDRSDQALVATTRASLSSMLVRLSDAAAAASASVDLVDGLISTVVEVRRTARSNGDWATADIIRERLRNLGIDVHDADGATTWTERPARPNPHPPGPES